tara:strand:+ start:443 stop:1471 length:1029 start_codon:yes stop_codon:yes gene_type:complete
MQKSYPDLKLRIDWYYSSETSPQSVGEGTTPSFPETLVESGVIIGNHQLDILDARPKMGIEYQNWGGADYVHPFKLGTNGLHFNASKFQDFIFTKHTNNTDVTLIDRHVSHADIDSDVIFDCTGKPASLEDYDIPEYIPVNAVHIQQCSWNSGPKYLYTKTIARPWGWVFVIPLTTRCSVGYLYNKDIVSLEAVKQDIQEVIHDLDVTATSNTNSFHFDNYVRKRLYEDRVIYAGNSGFFLEPMEATTLDGVNRVVSAVEHKLHNDGCNGDYNAHAKEFFREAERFIMLHYAAGSKWKNQFWDFAQERGRRALESEYLPVQNYSSFFPQISWTSNRTGLGLT